MDHAAIIPFPTGSYTSANHWREEKPYLIVLCDEAIDGGGYA